MCVSLCCWSWRWCWEWTWTETSDADGSVNSPFCYMSRCFQQRREDLCGHVAQESLTNGQQHCFSVETGFPRLLVLMCFPGQWLFLFLQVLQTYAWCLAEDIHCRAHLHFVKTIGRRGVLWYLEPFSVTSPLENTTNLLMDQLKSHCRRGPPFLLFFCGIIKICPQSSALFKFLTRFETFVMNYSLVSGLAGRGSVSLWFTLAHTFCLALVTKCLNWNWLLILCLHTWQRKDQSSIRHLCLWQGGDKHIRLNGYLTIFIVLLLNA